MDARERIVHDLLGTMVHVEVDRPIGFVHGDTVYPVNYGYIPGVMAGDGEEQDAYILGVEERVSSFDGRVIAAIRRRNDCEDKLVVAPDGTCFHQGEIASAVHFQEQYFDSFVVSLFRKSCGVIPFRQRNGEQEFLILLQTNNCWSFPKGHMEAGETETQTALRELLEETGLSARLIPGARAVLSYDIPPRTRKQVVLFLGEARGDVAVQEQEIVGCRWVTAQELRHYLHTDTFSACETLIGPQKTSYDTESCG